MLRLTVELVPFGIEKNARVLVRGKIANTGKDPNRPARGTYNVTLYDKGGSPYRKGRVEGFARTRDHVWKLVREALNAALKEEQEDEQ